MKHLLTAIACFFAMSMSAQFPYNPDSNGDNLVGIDDLLDLLPLYGDEFYPDGYPVIQYYTETLEFQGYNEPYQVYFINDSVDIFIISHVNNPTKFQLPAGDTYKAMKIAFDLVPNKYIGVWNGGWHLGWCNPPTSNVSSCNFGTSYFRLPNGNWYGDKSTD